MKAVILSLFVLLGSMTVAPKKADAGIVVAAAVSGPIGAAMIITGSILVVDNVLDALLGSSRIWTGIAGGWLFILDEDDKQTAEQSFNTIPAYIFDEIQAVAEYKKEDATPINSDFNEILLSDAEVDDLFITLDESVDQGELLKLRSLLTTSVVQ